MMALQPTRLMMALPSPQGLLALQTMLHPFRALPVTVL
jgi:hypothetical protein